MIKTSDKNQGFSKVILFVKFILDTVLMFKNEIEMLLMFGNLDQRDTFLAIIMTLRQI